MDPKDDRGEEEEEEGAFFSPRAEFESRRGGGAGLKETRLT